MKSISDCFLCARSLLSSERKSNHIFRRFEDGERKNWILRTNTAENVAKMETMKKQYSITVSPHSSSLLVLKCSMKPQQSSSERHKLELIIFTQNSIEKQP